jgi:hypothetical protein
MKVLLPNQPQDMRAMAMQLSRDDIHSQQLHIIHKIIEPLCTVGPVRLFGR